MAFTPHAFLPESWSGILERSVDTEDCSGDKINKSNT